MTFHRASRPVSLAVAALLLLSADLPLGSAQSLGDVAQREAERRKQATSGRVYTNGDLAVVDPPSSPPPPALAAPADGLPKTADEGTPEASKKAEPAAGTAPDTAVKPPLKGREKRDEQYWRTLARDLRGRFAKATADVAAREARIAEIDASPQTPTLVREREVISATLSRLQRDARSHSEELTRFLTRAGMAKVPEEWIQ